MSLSRIGVAVALVVALASGCSGDDEPGDVADTDTTSESTTEATEPPTESPGPEPEAVVFYSGSGVSAPGPCGDPAPSYFSLYEELDVNQEVRFGEVTPAGGGTLVGPVFVAPTQSRGPHDGRLVIDEKPGFGPLDGRPEWDDRVPLVGQLVQPGTYAVFAQVKLVPRTRMTGLDFSYFDSNATASSRLDVSAFVAKKCRG